MGRPEYRQDTADLSQYIHERNVVCSRGLLQALYAAHGNGETIDPEPEPVVEPEPEPPAPPSKPMWFAVVDEIDAPEPMRPRIETIQRVVADYFGVTRDDIISARRTGKLILPRHIAMALSRLLTLRSYPDIARRFGNRDHTVPIYACQKIDALVAKDAKVAADVEALKMRLARQ